MSPRYSSLLAELSPLVPTHDSPVMRHDITALSSVCPPRALRRLALAATLPLLVFGFVACAGSGQSGDSSETMTINEVIELLRKEGLTVTPGRQLSPNFAQEGLVLNTGVGDNIRVLEFSNSNSAAMTISRKSPSAGSAPFFYQRGNIMLVHTGNNSKVQQALESQFTPKRR